MFFKTMMADTCVRKPNKTLEISNETSSLITKYEPVM